MKKSKKVLLSAAIAAAIMGSVSVPQIYAYDLTAGNVNATTGNFNQLNVGGKAQFNDEVSIDKDLNVSGNVKANIIADEANVVKGNISNLSVSGKAEFNGTDGVSISDDLNVGGNVQANKIKVDDTIIADNANVVNSNISNLSVSGKAEFKGIGGVSISDDLKVGGNVQAGSLQVKGDAHLEGTTLANEIGAGKVVSDKIEAGKIEAGKTTTDSLTVTGNTRLEGTTLAKEIGAGKVVSDKIEAGKIEAGKTTTDSLTVTGNTRLEGTTLAKEIGAGKVVSDEIEAGKLTVGNIDNVEQAITDNKTAISDNKAAITNETNDRVAADAKLSNRISDNSSAIQSLRHDVSDLGTEIDNVGAISAALAGLHPLDWNGSGSKFQLSAAAGTYDGKQAMALGGFYHPNRNMLLSLGVSSSLGSDRKTAGNVGITFRVGKGSNGTVSDDVAERLAAMDQKISQLESQNQKLTSMLAIVDPSLTKEFPDVPANHWAYEAVSKLAGNGIVEGYPDGDFHGDRTMTRYEMAQVIYKALKKGGTVDQKLVKEFNKEIEAVKANDAQ